MSKINFYKAVLIASNDVKVLTFTITHVKLKVQHPVLAQASAGFFDENGEI